MALYHVLLLVSLYLLKPTRDSLFLSSHGPGELPFVFLVTTAVMMPVAYLHTRVNMIALFVQLVLVPWLMRVMGIGGRFRFCPECLRSERWE